MPVICPRPSHRLAVPPWRASVVMSTVASNEPFDMSPVRTPCTLPLLSPVSKRPMIWFTSRSASDSESACDASLIV
jgi:hypothetical protein